MVVGTIRIEFLLHGCNSLKEKRSIVKSIIERTIRKFKISAAEVDYMDTHRRGVIGIAAVSNDKRHLNSILDKVMNFIDNMNLVDIVDVQIELSQ